MSQAGMWVSHFWEVPSFRAEANAAAARTARSDQDIANFREHVINQMQNGGPNIPGLRQFTAAGGQFATPQRPVWAIVTPRGGTPNSWRYEPEVHEIKDVLKDLFPAAPPVIIDYETRSDPFSQTNTASGKILLQYDPMESWFEDPNQPCVYYQKATFRLWVEDRPNYVLEKYWAAETNQLITDFANHNPLRKRDDGPACQIPSSLQASTATKGQDMTFSTAPNPDETHWITVGASAGATTSNSSTSSPSSTSSAHVTSLNCMADGAPWFSPTRSVLLLPDVI